MPLSIIMRRIGDGLTPVDMDGFEALARVNMGKEVTVTVTQTRNIKFHRMFMGAVNFLFKHRDDYSVLDEFRKDVAIKLGHYTIETVRGKQKAIAKSISFAGMDDTDFSQFFDAFVEKAKEICPDLPESEIRAFNEILDGNSGKLGERITA